MIENPTISIIVPVYKAELYLSRCIDSILSQTFQDWECILVDDGSTDNSGSICDEYAMRDSRFRVIHKENGGVSSARQAGLDFAKGIYVIHADPDDYIDSYMFESLISYQKETDAELIIFDFYKIISNRKQTVVQRPHSLDNKQVLSDIIDGHIYASCWNKLIKRSLIIKYGVKFPKDINLGEDKCFWVDLLRNSIKISYLPKPLYYYDVTINNNSIVRTITSHSIESGIKMVSYLEGLLGANYKTELNEVKIRLKLRALQSNLLNAMELKKLYNEVNKILLKDVLCLKRSSIEDFALFFSVLRFPVLGRILLKIKSHVSQLR